MRALITKFKMHMTSYPFYNDYNRRPCRQCYLFHCSGNNFEERTHALRYAGSQSRYSQD